MADSQPIRLDVVIEDPRWAEALPDAEALAGRAALAGFAEAGFDEAVSICVMLADDAAVQVLNRSYRDQDKPTNVLSFPSEDMPTIPGEPRAFGDVALAFETLSREAQDAEIALADHFQHLIVHASLHLIGYTHDADEEAERMEALEIAALGGLGVANPYAGGRSEQTAYGTREP